MYNTKVVITYNTEEVFLESDNINEEVKFFIRDVIYRQEFLDIFGLDEYNDDEIKIAFNELYNKLILSPEFSECMSKFAEDVSSEDKQVGLMLMYSFDQLYLTHPRVCKFLDFTPLEKVEPKIETKFI